MVLLRVLGFSLAMILVFTLTANLLPQVEGEAPVEKEIDLGSLTMESFVALGEDIYNNKGTCTLCHNDSGRAPDLSAMNAVAAANRHLQNSRYQGKATDAAAYLMESMVDPGIYVVSGFGKKGSNDTESPMPAVDKPPIQLRAVEMDAVIAYLQSKDGNKITVELPSEAPVSTAVAPSSVTTVAEASAKYGCQACHSMLGTESAVGPELNTIAQRMGAEEIRQSIIDPDAKVAKGFVGGMMPGDYLDKMSARELEMIVRFLAEGKE